MALRRYAVQLLIPTGLPSIIWYEHMPLTVIGKIADAPVMPGSPRRRTPREKIPL
jgi:hypothetical protein